MPDRFHVLTVAAVERDTASAVRVRLAVPEALKPSFVYKPGQHLIFRRTVDGVEQRRTYSICSGPADGDLTVTIKALPGGLFSSHVMPSLAAGDVVEVMEPAGRFVLGEADGLARTCLAIAAGSGITPVICMIRHLLAREPESRFILVYGNRDTGSILFRRELEELKDRYLQRLTVVHVLSQGGAESDNPLLNGRIDATKIENLLPRLIDPRSISEAFLCGPGSMAKEALGALVQIGLPRERIRHEFFYRGSQPFAERTPPSAKEPDQGQHEAILIIDGVRHQVAVHADEAIVDAALRSGLNVPYSCKGGMCCTCRAKLVEGQADMAQNFSLAPWEVERGFILTCQSRIRSGRVVVDYDAV